jgi:hypothetical protein
LRLEFVLEVRVIEERVLKDVSEGGFDLVRQRAQLDDALGTGGQEFFLVRHQLFSLRLGHTAEPHRWNSRIVKVKILVKRNSP